MAATGEQQDLVKPLLRSTSSHKQAELVRKKVSFDALAMEWLQSCVIGLDTRLYLTARLLPSLILSLEKLLKAVEDRHLVDIDEMQSHFNPINYLAEQLMRTNPRYSQLSQDSSYTVSLQQMANELQLMISYGNLTEKEKEQEKLRKKEQEAEKMVEEAAKEKRRRDMLSLVVDKWRSAEGVCPLELQQMIISWLEDMTAAAQMEESAGCLSAVVTMATQHTDVWSHQKTIAELVKCCMKMEDNIFMLFIEHLKTCANEKNVFALKKKRLCVLQDVYSLLDEARVSMIPRQLVMNLLTSYYSTAPSDIRDTLTPPDTWPFSDRQCLSEDEKPPTGPLTEELFQLFLVSLPPHPSSCIAKITKNTSSSMTRKEPGEQDEVKKDVYSDDLQSDAKEDARERLPPLPSGPGNQWSPVYVDASQFAQLCDWFLSDDAPADGNVVQSLLQFLSTSNTQLSSSASQMQHLAILKSKAYTLGRLFDQWDTSCCGHLPLDELSLLLSKWSTESSSTLDFSVLALAPKQLSKVEYINLLHKLTFEMSQEQFENLIAYLQSSILVRDDRALSKSTRQQWLASLHQFGHNQQLQPVLKRTVELIEQNELLFGGDKGVGVSIAVLDKSGQEPSLLYLAASQPVADYVVGKRVPQSTVPVSFNAIDTRTPVYIPSVTEHEGVFFFNQSLNYQDKHKGSLVVVPIVTTREVLGVISVDVLTQKDTAPDSFRSEDINFLEGVGQCVGEVMQHIVGHRRWVSVADVAMRWLVKKCASVIMCDLLLVKPVPNKEEYQLCPVGNISHRSMSKQITIISNDGNMFRDYLFQCVTVSEPVAVQCCCRHHLAVPIRDSTGCAVAVLDITLNQSAKMMPLPHCEVIAMTSNLLTKVYQEAIQDDSSVGMSSMAVFHELMLSEIIKHFTTAKCSMTIPLLSANTPPVVGGVLGAVMMLLESSGDHNKSCQLSVDGVATKMQQFNIATLDSALSHRVATSLQDISVEEVFRQDSLLLKYMYLFTRVACAAKQIHEGTLCWLVDEVTMNLL